MTDPFDQLFENFERTAFRYEGRQVYAVEGQEAEQIEAWRRRAPRSERSLRTSPWLQRIALTTLTEGKEWCRIRVVDQPVPEYLLWELAGLTENQAVGDITLMVDRADAVSLPDFWLFDGGMDHAVAAIMNYTDDGEFEDFTIVTDPAHLHVLEQARQGLLGAAVPLNVWLAEQGRSSA